MKIGILECGQIPDPLQQQFGDYPQMFQTLFSRYSQEITFVVYPVYQNIFPGNPGNPSDCDGYITTGSKFSVNDSFGWITELEGFVRNLQQCQIPFVGICFGHQILAKAFGGVVGKAWQGWGIGAYQNKVCIGKNWMTPAQSQVNLLASHQDQVTRLPENTEVLASNDHCQNAIIQYGDTMLGIQGHPEFTADYSAALTESRRNIIPKERIAEQEPTLSSVIDSQLVASWIVEFFAAALKVVSK